MIHKCGHIRLHFRLHSLTESFQCIENTIYTARHLLTTRQSLASVGQVNEKNRKNIIGIAIYVRLKMFGKLANGVKGYFRDFFKEFDTTIIYNKKLYLRCEREQLDVEFPIRNTERMPTNIWFECALHSLQQ